MWSKSGYFVLSTKIRDPKVLDTSTRISSRPRLPHEKYTIGASGCFQMQLITCKISGGCKLSIIVYFYIPDSTIEKGKNKKEDTKPVGWMILCLAF